MKLPKQAWKANDYAITFCLELSGRILKRRIYKIDDFDKWAIFYDYKTRKRIFACNLTFAKAHFYKTNLC